jgi:haloalkane dehalogenase
VPALRRSFLGLGGCFEDKSLIDGEFYDLFIAPLLSSPRVLRGQLGLARDFDWSVLDNMAETHARIKAKVALIWGVDDPWFPLAKARRMMPQFSRGAELHEINPGKLFIHEEKPDIWAGHAKRFLERAAVRPAA